METEPIVCRLCKLLHNSYKREILLKIYTSSDGVNVGYLADEMEQKGLVLSGVSHYLKELEDVGAIRRSRAGRYVNYFPNVRDAPEKIRVAIEAFVRNGANLDAAMLEGVFGALMNPFRAKVIAALAKAGSISGEEICAKTEHQLRLLKRDLKMAIDAGLIWSDDSDSALATYHYVEPTDEFVKLLVSLC